MQPRGLTQGQEKLLWKGRICLQRYQDIFGGNVLTGPCSMPSSVAGGRVSLQLVPVVTQRADRARPPHAGPRTHPIKKKIAVTQVKSNQPTLISNTDL